MSGLEAELIGSYTESKLAQKIEQHHNNTGYPRGQIHKDKQRFEVDVPRNPTKIQANQTFYTFKLRLLFC